VEGRTARVSYTAVDFHALLLNSPEERDIWLEHWVLFSFSNEETILPYC
jgi:hypothetical protein